jgi:hypothetical protein
MPFTAATALEAVTMAKAKHTTKPTKPKSDPQRPRDDAKPFDRCKAAKAHPDSKLIKACVEYGFLLGGSESGFKIDPTDSYFAGSVDCQNCERALEIITRASKYRPTTLDGLAAKGAVAKLICDNSYNYINDYEQDFLQTLAETLAVFIN